MSTQRSRTHLHVLIHIIRNVSYDGHSNNRGYHIKVMYGCRVREGEKYVKTLVIQKKTSVFNRLICVALSNHSVSTKMNFVCRVIEFIHSRVERVYQHGRVLFKDPCNIYNRMLYFGTIGDTRQTEYKGKHQTKHCLPGHCVLVCRMSRASHICCDSFPQRQQVCSRFSASPDMSPSSRRPANVADTIALTHRHMTALRFAIPSSHSVRQCHGEHFGKQKNNNILTAVIANLQLRCCCHTTHLYQ